MRTWYIEDAGGGCRAFSEVLVLVSEKPREVYTSLVPLTWQTGQTLEEVVLELVLEMMSRAGVTKEDKILVCSGNIFNDLHKYLQENQYNWSTARMEGLAHEIAEQVFFEQIVNAGFPAYIKLTSRNYREFYQLVEKWVLENISRLRYLKDRRVRQKPIGNKYCYKANRSRPRHCSKCHSSILPYTPMVECRMNVHGKKVHRYYHPECSPVKPLKNKLVTIETTLNGQPTCGVVTKSNREERCTLCQKSIPAGQPAFFCYNNDQLLSFHLSCLSIMNTPAEA
ncbi:MAG: hypothetical protein ACOY81_01280 [Bacillota bacterium]